MRGNAAWVILAGVLAAAVGVLVDLMPLVPLGLAAVALAAGTYIAVPAIALAVLLVLRPSLDNLGQLVSLGGTNILGMMAAGTVVGGGAYLLVRRPPLPRAVVIASAAFIGLALVSLSWTMTLDGGISDWIGFAVYPVVLGVAAGTVRDVRGFHRLVALVLAAAVVPILVGIFQLATGQRLVKEGYASVPGPMVHPNSFALLLLVAATLALIAFMQTRDVRLRRILAVGLMLAAACFFFTYARAAWGGFVGVMGILALLQYRRLLGLGLILVVVVALAFPTTTSQIAGRFADLSPTSTSYSNNSLSWRKELWQRMLPYAQERPVLGYGIGSFLPLSNLEIGMYDYKFQADGQAATYMEIYPHNDYLMILIELGLVGLALWTAVLLACAATAWQARRVPELRPYAIGVAAIVMALIAIAATDNVKDTQSVMVGVFALVGGLYGASRGAVHTRPASA